MGSFSIDKGLDDLMEGLSSLDLDLFAPEALTKAGPIVEREMKHLSEPHKRTGAMAKSIKTAKVKQNKKTGDWSVIVRPTGTDKKGVRNMEKLAYLEYGVKMHNQPATPVITPTIAKTEKPVQDSIEQSFDAFLRDRGF